MKQEGLREVTLRLAEDLKNLYKDKLKAVILYGSVARGTAQEFSEWKDGSPFYRNVSIDGITLVFE